MHYDLGSSLLIIWSIEVMTQDIPPVLLMLSISLSVYHSKVAAHGLVSIPVPILLLLVVKNIF
jgi:hypothetical protein